MGGAPAEHRRVEEDCRAEMRIALNVILTLALASALAGCVRKPGKRELKLTAQRDRLVAEKGRLQEELRAETLRLVVLPDQVNPDVGLVVALPDVLLKEILSRTLTEVINGLSLKITDLRLHLAQTLKIKINILKATLGDYELDILVQEARGKVKAGAPKVSIGHRVIRLEAPLKIPRGEGRARIHFRFAGRGLAKVACSKLDAARDVEGALGPLALDFRGSVFLRVVGSDFVVDPDIPPQKSQLFIEPSLESWAKVEQIVNAQKGACRLALKKINVVQKLRELLRRGFPVTIHPERLKTARIPLAVTEQLPFEDRRLEVTATPILLEIRDDYTWFGLSFGISKLD